MKGIIWTFELTDLNQIVMNKTFHTTVRESHTNQTHLKYLKVLNRPESKSQQIKHNEYYSDWIHWVSCRKL